MGFFICSSPLKEDTVKNIEQLQQAKYKILVITGDNILTAAKVGLNLKLGETIWILEKEEGNFMLEHEDGTKAQINNLKDLKHKTKDHPEVILATSTSKDLPH